MIEMETNGKLTRNLTFEYASCEKISLLGKPVIAEVKTEDLTMLIIRKFKA